MNASDACQPGPAQHVRQHCLCLIVGGVRRRDVRHFSLFHQRCEKLVARSPRRIFHIQLLALRFGCNVHALGKKFQPVALRQLRNKFFVSIRRAPAQLMVQMNHGKNDTERGLQLKKEMEQRDGVRTA